MKNLIVRFVFIFGLVGGFLNGAEIATVKLLEGTLKASMQNQTVKLKVGDRLSSDMVLQTSKGSSTTIVFDDNSVLVLGENSIMNLQKYIFKPKVKKYSFELYLKSGSATFESGKIGEESPESFIFRTPQGTVSIRGTKFAVKID